MLTSEQENFLAIFADREIAAQKVESDRIAKSIAIQEAILARDAALAEIKAVKEAEIQVAIQPFEDEILNAKK